MSLFSSIAFLTLLGLQLACGSKSSSTSGEEVPTPGPTEPPAAEPDPASKNPTLPELQALATVGSELEFPEQQLFSIAALESIKPSDSFEVEKHIATFDENQLIIFDSGVRFQEPRPCSQAFEPFKEGSFTASIDGDLSEWEKAYVGLDPSGDGLENLGIDLLRTGISKNEEGDFFFALKFASDFPTTWPDAFQIRVSFYSYIQSNLELKTPHQDNLLEQFVLSKYGLYVGLTQSPPGGYTTDFSQATSRENIEFSIPERLLGFKPSPIMNIHIQLETDDGQVETTGNHYMGLQADYLCAVRTPYGVRFIQMLREQGIEDRQAELDYRAMIAAANVVEEIQGFAPSLQSSFRTLVQQYSPSYQGQFASTSGIKSIFTFNNQTFWPRTNFHILKFKLMAHEYAHIYNASDWQLPGKIYRESHSEKSAALALGERYGLYFTQKETNNSLMSFKDAEASKQSLIPLDNDDAWDTSTQFPTYHFYDKAHGFLNAWLGIFSSANGKTLRDVFKEITILFASTDEENKSSIERLTETLKTDLTKEDASSPLDGWGSGTYSQDFPRPEIEMADLDFDGIIDQLEAGYGFNSKTTTSQENGRKDGIALSLQDSFPESRLTEPELIFADQNLADWDPKFSESFRTLTFVADNACPSWASLKRASLVSDGYSVIAGAEFVSPSEPNDGNEKGLAFFLFEGEQEVLSVNAFSGKSEFAAFAGEQANIFFSVIPFFGTQWEIPIHRSLLKNEAISPDTFWNGCSYSGKSVCQCTARYPLVIRLK